MSVEIVREHGKRPSALEVTKQDPSKAYRWVSTKPTNFARRKAEGWTPSQRDKTEAKYAANVGEDSTIKHGDLILCEMPKARREMLVKARQARISEIQRAMEHTDTSKGIIARRTKGR